MKKICVYTCITGDYDNLCEIIKKEAGIDYICYTNNKKIKSKTWKVIYINDNEDNIRIARKYKILGSDYIIGNYDISVWVDGNFQIKDNVRKFISNLCNLDRYSFITFKHSKRDCIYDEAKKCIELGKDKKDIINKQMKVYQNDNYPAHNGLAETGIIVRNLRNNDVIKLCQIWYEQIQKYSFRDQLSFNYCASKIKNLKIKYINRSIYDNGYFYYEKHSNKNTELAGYRIYFDVENEYNDQFDFRGKYRISKNKYIIKLKVPHDTKKTVVELEKVPFIVLSNLKVNGKRVMKNKIHYFNRIENKNNSFFYNENGAFELYTKFSKDSTLVIELDMHIASNDEIIKNISCVVDDLNLANLNISTEVQRKNDLLNENQQLKKEVDRLNSELSSILSSKSWKLIRSFDKLRRK